MGRDNQLFGQPGNDYRDKPECTVNGGAKPGYIFTAAGIKLVAFHEVLAENGTAGNGQDGFTL